MLLASFIVFLIAYLGFALTQNIFLIAALFVFYGLYQGIFRAVGKAFASDFVPEHLRASGVGWYSTTVGVMQLVASAHRGSALGPRRARERLHLWRRLRRARQPCAGVADPGRAPPLIRSLGSRLPGEPEHDSGLSPGRPWPKPALRPLVREMEEDRVRLPGRQKSVKLHRKAFLRKDAPRCRLFGGRDRDPVAVRRGEPVVVADPESGRRGAEAWGSGVMDDLPGLKRHGIDPED